MPLRDYYVSMGYFTLSSGVICLERAKDFDHMLIYKCYLYILVHIPDNSDQHFDVRGSCRAALFVECYFLFLSSSEEPRYDYFKIMNRGS